MGAWIDVHLNNILIIKANLYTKQKKNVCDTEEQKREKNGCWKKKEIIADFSESNKVPIQSISEIPQALVLMHAIQAQLSRNQVNFRIQLTRFLLPKAALLAAAP